MKKRYLYSAALLTAAVLAACGGKKAAAEKGPAPEVTLAETAAEAKEEAAEEKADEGAKASSNEEADEVFQQIGGTIFGFSSGVGAWQTTLTTNADGSFDGYFNDANMGESGEGYDGTIYTCSFKGKFGPVTKVDEKTWKTSVAELKIDDSDFKDDDSYIEYDTRYVLSPAYGLSEGDEIMIYAPGSKTAELPEKYLEWAEMTVFFSEVPETVDEYSLYNETGDAAFFPDHYAMGDFENEGVSDFDPSDYDGGAEEPTQYYLDMKNAFANQAFPENAMLPDLPVVRNYVSKAYESVTMENLQGAWINEYKESGHQFREVLSINGERGRIETWKDGVTEGVWNAEGFVSIEDRTDRKVCPAFRINDPETGMNICTIYIRWVKDYEFYDGGFTKTWKRMDQNEFDYLFDTVTLENLQGVWYSEFADDGGFYQDILTIEGDEATLFETIDGKPANGPWNMAGTPSLTMVDYLPGKTFPQLIIEGHNADDGAAGIYISSVDEYQFYDQGFCRYWIRIDKDSIPFADMLDD